MNKEINKVEFKIVRATTSSTQSENYSIFLVSIIVQDGIKTLLQFNLIQLNIYSLIWKKELE
jgi:hypothetical protein